MTEYEFKPLPTRAKPLCPQCHKPTWTQSDGRGECDECGYVRIVPPEAQAGLAAARLALKQKKDGK